VATRYELETGELRCGRMNTKRFAEHIGVAHGTVKRWATEGLPSERYPPMKGVWIDPEQARVWLAERFSGRKTIAFQRKAVLYFAQRHDGAIKLGWTSDVIRRVSELRRDCGQAVHLRACWPGRKPDELRLHEKLQPYRLHGEWYRDAPEVLGMIASVTAAA